MVSTGLPPLDQILGAEGYPEKSAVLVSGPPGIGKEALGYWFMQSSLRQRDFSIHATRLSVNEVIHDEKAFGISDFKNQPFWIARDGGMVKLNVGDLEGFLTNVSEVLRTNNTHRKVSIFLDSLSSWLILNPLDRVYKFVSDLLAEVKNYDTVLLATLEEGMHDARVVTAMEQLFDGHIELSLYRIGLRSHPYLRIGKMRGLRPNSSYYSVSFSKSGISLEHIGSELTVFNMNEGQSVKEGFLDVGIFREPESAPVFDFLVKAFIEDYMAKRLSMDQSGWRTRIRIVKSTKVTQVSLYGWRGRQGPILKELLSNGLVETRVFPRERGRGGDVVKMRIAYDKEPVKRYVDKSVIGPK